MKTVRQVRDSEGLAFSVEDGGSKVVVKVTCHETQYRNARVYVFYDTDMGILFGPSRFLTEDLANQEENSRLQAVSAMKLLYSYALIHGVDPCEFDLATASGFVQFLRGTAGAGVACSYEALSLRAETTVSSYLKHVRALMRCLGASASPFLQRMPTAKVGMPEGYGGYEGPFSLSPKVSASTEAPDSITLEEYRTLLDQAGEEPDDPARPMLRLMYEHGLRIGEVLGLAIEDLAQTVGRDGAMAYTVKIRNRLSDGIDQCAKTAMKVRSREQYASPDYARRNHGYQEVFISESLYGDIASYIEHAHADEGGAAMRRADSVEGAGSTSYIFLNGKGAPLSGNLWNKRLRSMFRRASLPVDVGVRRTNLNHRLRHGYAMFLLREGGLDDFAVKTLMRHRSILSTQAYAKPTAEDVRDMQAAVIREMEDAVFGRGRADGR